VGVAEVEALVAVGAPVRGEVEGAEDVAFDDAAGTLAINFMAAAVGAGTSGFLDNAEGACGGNRYSRHFEDPPNMGFDRRYGNLRACQATCLAERRILFCGQGRA